MQVTELLELVSNPEKFKNALAELDSRKKAIEEALAAQVEVNQIAELKRKAEKALAEAQGKAAKLLEETDAAITKAKEALKEQADKVDAKTASVAIFKAQAEAKFAEATSLFDDAQKLAKEAAKRSAALFKREEELSVKEQEVEARLAKLRSIMA